MAVRPQDILFRAGGGTLKRLQTLVSAGAGRAEVAHTFTRADSVTCATLQDADATVRRAAANTLRLDWPSALVDASGAASGGFLSEGTRTNICKFCRDLSDATWTKASTTAAKTQTGVDGVANSATLLTATGANGFATQSAVLASSTRLQSMWVKRITGTGTVSMSTDGGALYTAVTVTSAWTRVSIPAQTVTNPQWAIKLATNGDAIAVDIVQNETGPFWSSAILAAGAATQARAADSLTALYNFGPLPEMTVLVRLARPTHADVVGALGVSPGIFSFGAGTAPRIGAYFDPAARNIIGVIDTATTDATISAAIPAGQPTISFQFKNLTTGGQVAIDTGSGLSAFSSAATAFSAFSSQTARIGRYDDELFGVIGDMLVLRGLHSRTDAMAVP